MDDCVEMFEDIVSERTFSQCRFGDVGLRIQRKETTFNNNVWMQGILSSCCAVDPTVVGRGIRLQT